MIVTEEIEQMLAVTEWFVTLKTSVTPTAVDFVVSNFVWISSPGLKNAMVFAGDLRGTGSNVTVCVALNSNIIVTSTTTISYGRITGNILSGATCNNNAAWSDMLV
jgi:hypothetical protein